jgi:putative transposase
MVRAGVVSHPSEWGRFGGYSEIQNPKKRYALIDHTELIALLGFRNMGDLIRSHSAWVDEALQGYKKARDGKWTETIAVGSKGYVDSIKEQLGSLFLKRRVEGRDGQYELREPPALFYNTENAFPWHSNDPDLFSPFS